MVDHHHRQSYENYYSSKYKYVKSIITGRVMVITADKRCKRASKPRAQQLGTNDFNYGKSIYKVSQKFGYTKIESRSCYPQSSKIVFNTKNVQQVPISMPNKSGTVIDHLIVLK